MDAPRYDPGEPPDNDLVECVICHQRVEDRNMVECGFCGEAICERCAETHTACPDCDTF